MTSVYYDIKNGSNEISISLKDNGLLEISIPKGCTKPMLWDYFNNMDMLTFDEIIDSQNKAKERFRKKLYELIDKYKKEFGIPILIKLRLPMKSKSISFFKIECHGNVFECNLSILAHLQYMPDDVVEKIIRAMVYKIADKYEDMFNNIVSIIGVTDFLTAEDKTVEYYNVPKENKYHVNADGNVINEIMTDYDEAFNAYTKFMKKNSIHILK